MTPPQRPLPLCNLIKIEKACEGLTMSVVEGTYTRFPANGDTFSCQNDNRINNTYVYYQPQPGNDTRILYYGGEDRWIVTETSDFCDNSAFRMAQFSASKTYPHRETTGFIFCWNGETGPDTRLVPKELEISCLDPAPTLAPAQGGAGASIPSAPTQAEASATITPSSATSSATSKVDRAACLIMVVVSIALYGMMS